MLQCEPCIDAHSDSKQFGRTYAHTHCSQQLTSIHLDERCVRHESAPVYIVMDRYWNIVCQLNYALKVKRQVISKVIDAEYMSWKRFSEFMCLNFHQVQIRVAFAHLHVIFLNPTPGASPIRKIVCSCALFPSILERMMAISPVQHYVFTQKGVSPM